MREIGKGEATGAAHDTIVIFVVGLKDAVHTLGVFQRALEMVPDDGAQAVGEGSAEGSAQWEFFADFDGGAASEDVGCGSEGFGE